MGKTKQLQGLGFGQKTTDNTSVQRLVEREQKRIEFQQKLAKYPDWDREEQIRKNQRAIKTMQDWLSQEISEEEEIARDKHYKIFERCLNRDLEKAE